MNFIKTAILILALLLSSACSGNVLPEAFEPNLETVICEHKYDKERSFAYQAHKKKIINYKEEKLRKFNIYEFATLSKGDLYINEFEMENYNCDFAIKEGD